MVLSAARAGGEEGRASLEELCRAYWYPLYAYLRRSGRDSGEAADLVQGLFTSLLERGSPEDIRAEGGRFRAFPLGALRNHASDERDRARAQRRGGGRPPIPIDSVEAESRFRLEPGDPEAAFERQWAREVLARALAALREQYGGDGRGELFAALGGTLEADAEPPGGPRRYRTTPASTSSCPITAALSPIPSGIMWAKSRKNDVLICGSARAQASRSTSR